MTAAEFQTDSSGARLTVLQKLLLVVLSPIWMWLAAAATVVTYFLVNPAHRYPGAIVSTVTFAAVITLMSGCRPVSKTLLCPWNWALFLFGLQLVVLPFSVLTAGPSLGALPRLPSSGAMNLAMLLSCVAFVAFTATYQYLSQSSPHWKRTYLTGEEIPATAYPTRVVQAYIVFGLVGLFLAFHTPSALLEYFEDPATYVGQFSRASHTLSGVGSLLLRPFLGFGLVMIWCKWIDRKSQSRSARRAAVITLVGIMGVILSCATFSYNRGAFVVPLVCMLTVLGAQGKRISLGVLALAGSVLIIVLLLAPYYAVYRNTGLTGSRTATDLLSDPQVSSLFAENINVLDTLQMYGSGPQYTGYLIEQSRWGTRPYLGSTLFPSLVQPIPILGRTFSESSGPMIYNEMIYGTPAIFDQVIPFSSEMFLNFQVFGIIAGFCFLGAVASWLQRGFERATTSLEIYIWQYSAVWVLFLIIGSISVAVQILFYFYWPIYIFLACKHFAGNALKGQPEWQAQS
jgi:hypothetical protein